MRIKCQQQWLISAVSSHVHNLNCRFSTLDGAKKMLQQSHWLSLYRQQQKTRLVYIVTWTAFPHLLLLYSAYADTWH